MRHFFVWPSAKLDRAIECAKKWRAKGYEACVGLDEPKHFPLHVDDKKHFDAVMWIKSWSGYYVHVNRLVDAAFLSGADLVTVGGDDQEPPSQGADQHTKHYFDRFPSGFGVMQCTGDRQGEVIDGRVNSERICGSPTFGEEWNLRAFGGSGGFPEGFRSFYADELLMEVTQRLGLLYQEPLFSIDHVHWAFCRTQKQDYHDAASKNWDLDRGVFMGAKAQNFKSYVDLFH